MVKVAALLALVAAVALAWNDLWREYERGRDGLYSRRIDSYLPDLAALAPGQLQSRKEGARFLAYYHLIDREVPGTAGINEALGYCYYYSGDIRQAEKYFGQALIAAPNSFAARYDLGVIYYRQQDFEKAGRYFQQAVTLPEQRTFDYVMASRVFSQLRVVKRMSPADVFFKVRQEYGDAKRLIRKCMEKQGKSRDLLLLAMRYNDLLKVWVENGGEPSSMDLILF